MIEFGTKDPDPTGLNNPLYVAAENPLSKAVREIVTSPKEPENNYEWPIYINKTPPFIHLKTRQKTQ